MKAVEHQQKHKQQLVKTTSKINLFKGSCSCVYLTASRKQTKLQSCNFTDLREHWYHSDGYYFQKSDKPRKDSQESLRGACSYVKTVTVVFVHTMSSLS